MQTEHARNWAGEVQLAALVEPQKLAAVDREWKSDLMTAQRRVSGCVASSQCKNARLCRHVAEWQCAEVGGAHTRDKSHNTAQSCCR